MDRQEEIRRKRKITCHLGVHRKEVQIHEKIIKKGSFLVPELCICNQIISISKSENYLLKQSVTLEIFIIQLIL